MGNKTTKPKLSPESKAMVKEAAKRTKLKKDPLWPEPHKDEYIVRKYLVEVRTLAHREDQLARLDKTVRREIHHSLGKEGRVFLFSGNEADPFTELFYDPKEKA